MCSWSRSWTGWLVRLARPSRAHPVAEVVVTGEAEIGMRQINVILPIAGADQVGLARRCDPASGREARPVREARNDSDVHKHAAAGRQGQAVMKSRTVREFYSELLRALPDMRINVLRQHATNDAVVLEVVIRGVSALQYLHV
jgi:hypothetical protein